MKLKRALIRNFKGVREVEIDFTRDDGSLRPLTALVGDNGSGKTTVLQAIALTLSLATRRTAAIERFLWPGFFADRMGSLGPTHVELDIVFDAAEIEATSRLFESVFVPSATGRSEGFKIRPVALLPGSNSRVTLTLEATELGCEQGAEGVLQFQGRSLLTRTLETEPAARQQFREFGDVFWFDQYRSLGARLPDSQPWAGQIGLGRVDRIEKGSGSDSDSENLHESWMASVERVRDELVVWWGYHKADVKSWHVDVLLELEQRFAALFPGARFVGPAPRDARGSGSASGSYFFIEREGRRYDIAEMSSGEQAIFPLLMAFVRLSIARSVVLIDELELHLHPPEQQALLTSLRKIGPDCQFIITTHSPYLTEALSDREIVRLEDGRVCR